MYYDSGVSGVAQTAELNLLQLTDSVVAVECCLHNCSNGVSWGLKSITAKVEQGDVHISIAALQNAQSDLYSHIDKFLMTHRHIAKAEVEQ